METAALQHLFHPEPGQWGLRGDPHLWRELRQVFEVLQLPDSPAAIEALLHHLYLNLVGEVAVAGRQPFVARYASGGMSSGHVAAAFWLEKGFPLLQSRLQELLRAQLAAAASPET
ncbi:hypothetical protein [Hymenobacter sp. GOD-10R]|uniref:hypothetical protein n=1 Tax=Hymenobacter sp. GOD-10R TaxID=3093922 RepID=UPI002D78E820|nr:hypothetical protein [Hymenobacter sp. GOD-10R]WRQ31129.1 hypothetical protein SD425_12755 [Hymenobacter sp. GOD-10R]